MGKQPRRAVGGGVLHQSADLPELSVEMGLVQIALISGVRGVQHHQRQLPEIKPERLSKTRGSAAAAGGQAS